MEQYVFAPTVCGAELEEELAAAIEKRTEIFSRASLPGMWKKTDAMNRYAARGSGRKGVLRKILPWVLILAVRPADRGRKDILFHCSLQKTKTP